MYKLKEETCTIQPLVLLRKTKQSNVAFNYKYGNLETGQGLNSNNYYLSIDAVGYIDTIFKEHNVQNDSSRRAKDLLKETFMDLQLMYLELIKENPEMNYQKLITKMEDKINQKEYELIKEDNKILKKSLIYDTVYTDGSNSIK